MLGGDANSPSEDRKTYDVTGGFGATSAVTGESLFGPVKTSFGPIVPFFCVRGGQSRGQTGLSLLHTTLAAKIFSDWYESCESARLKSPTRY